MTHLHLARKGLLPLTIVSLLLAACSSGGSDRSLAQAETNAKGTARSPGIAPPRMVTASTDEPSPLWEPRIATDRRVRAFNQVLASGDVRERGELRAQVAANLPTEPRREMVVAMSMAAGEGGWTECTVPLLRSLARPLRGVEDATRSEAVALSRLHPERSLVDLAELAVVDPWSVVLGADGVGGGLSEPAVQAECWGLLVRLDPSMERAAALLGEGGASSLALIALFHEQTGIFPYTSTDFLWATQLGAMREPGGTLERLREQVDRHGLRDIDGGHLELRHVPAIEALSSINESWLSLSSQRLAILLDVRLKRRMGHRRQTSPGEQITPEDWATARGRLSRADLLLLLAIDLTLDDPMLREDLFRQVELDRGDRTTEYGGLMFAADRGEPARVMSFTPRPAERLGDRRFVASTDMLRAGALALAHYHFHVQSAASDEYAGPSEGDLEYARTFARACVVFTSLGPDGARLNADCYFPDGTVVDLGEIGAGETPRD
ncbi:MAG: hypothetical protein IPK69_00330 [Phycisphaerales bacterium]|nr:MAG: hypothetical protein IPK69_00330 [Phycisphaerales bacterium]